MYIVILCFIDTHQPNLFQLISYAFQKLYLCPFAQKKENKGYGH